MLSPAPIARVFCAILVAADIGEFRYGDWTELHAVGGVAWLDEVRVEQAGTASGEQAQVAVHRVLIERDQEIKLTVCGGGILSGPVRIVRKVWPPRMMD